MTRSNNDHERPQSRPTTGHRDDFRTVDYQPADGEQRSQSNEAKARLIKAAQQVMNQNKPDKK